MIFQAKKFSLPQVEGLSPETITTHLALYEGYVTNTNTLMTQLNNLAKHGTEFSYTISEMRRRLGFEWNGMRLHEIYFSTIEGGATSLLGETKLYKALHNQYGSFTDWFDIFSKLSARGPGWALLQYDPESKHFFHTWVADHDIGVLASLPILLAVDHWEHAYIRDYEPSKKSEYIALYLSLINWKQVNEQFERIA